ncbi:CPBP family intramembrane glutamic endopeptidase [Bacillus sp. B1-b2]|uniref:CPBP family intramembrane glutamic endopeptidase n=1 Tax=Bacillus sp. B1-b2 TaxID=2653201 RepID=UPI001261E121|nr:type II CAAX endopeptidase family protein [Bacillus sp. B1-b2]KAB7665562.1 CPBP family intramembrane metalloprotease [Bacillus sp. B1-b2]
MKKEYWIILISYIAMQLSTYVGTPLFLFIASIIGYDATEREVQFNAGVSWLIFSFIVTLIICLFILRKEMQNPMRKDVSSIPSAIGWAIGGVFLSLFAQSIAGMIEQLIGIEAGSENTEQIMTIIDAAPFVIIVVSIVGPILEELVFRKVIFGSLYERFGYFLSALISSLIFAVAHFDFAHILLYASMGFTFSFLYVRTKRILVPIFAHVSMNTLVVIIQLNYDKIIKWQEEYSGVTQFIGGLFK